MSTVLVTGASRGIGREIAVAFAEAGHDVAFCFSKDKAGAEETARLIRAAGGEALPFFADVSEEKQVEEMFSALLGLEIVVNNAGISLFSEIAETSLSDWERVFAVNVRGAFLCTRAAVPKLLKRGGGCIVNVSSMWGETGASCESAYSASKAALIGFTKAAAKELAPSGIRVNCVAPGIIDTEMNAHLSREEREAFVCENVPLLREGTAGEVARAVLFLAKHPYITGEVLRVNGGAVI